MISSDPRHSEIYRLSAQQLRNVFDAGLLARYKASRWWLTIGYLCMMAAALPVERATPRQVVLYFCGCALGLAAAQASKPRRQKGREKAPVTGV